MKKRLFVTILLSFFLLLSIFLQLASRPPLNPESSAWSSNSIAAPSALPQLSVEESQDHTDRLPPSLKRLYAMGPEDRLAIMRQEYGQAAQEKRLNSLVQTAEENRWVSLGPTTGAGKMNALAFHPTNSRIIYAGADHGGVWKSTDGGASWAPLTDSIPFLRVFSLAVVPSSPNLVYAGLSHGIILKSTDEGATWIIPDRPLGDSTINRISIHPNNPQDIVVATRGAFRSTDGGASWSNVVFDHFVDDLVRDPQDARTLYAITRGGSILKSIDAGATWSDKSIGFRGGSRAALAVSPSDPRVLYGSIADSSFDPAAFSHVYKSTDAGESWSDLPSVANNPDFMISHFLSAFGVAQAFRNNSIIVSPTDPNTVLAAGVSYIRSTDGGVSWHKPRFSGGGMHWDAVDMRYHNSVLWIANDGGLWSSPDNGNTSTEHNRTLVTRQYYALALDSVDTSLMLAGSQDNGTDRREEAGTVWGQVIGADGFDCAINPKKPSIAYGTIQNGVILRASTLKTLDPSWRDITPKFPAGELSYFYTLLRMDINNPATLYTRTHRVWRTTDEGASWHPLPTTTTDGSNWHDRAILDIAIAPSNSAVLMVVKENLPFDPRPFHIFRSTDAGATWIDVRPISEYVTGLEIDPRNPNIVYAIGQNEAAVQVTVDAGRTWVGRGSGLPDFQGINLATILRADPADANTIYCGTAVGLYRSTDKGVSWAKFGTGLPNSPVTDLRLLDDGSVVRVATFGRGVWELQAHPPLPPQITGASVSGKTLLVRGNYFDRGAVILLNGQKQKTLSDSENLRTALIGKKAGKKIRAGDTLQVRNSNGSLSNEFTFNR